MRAWVLYDGSELQHNRFFADRLVDCLEEIGFEASIVTTGVIPDYAPDLVMNRSRNWRIASKLESEGAVIVNSSEVSRICNDKLLTYNLADDLGIPHLPVSIPGGTLPPGPPWVVKSRTGHGGEEVRLADDMGELDGLCTIIPEPLIQSCASTLGRDLRVYVLGDEIIASVMRSNDDDFRANYSLGGGATLFEPPDDIRDSAVRMARALESDLVGVDFIFSDGPMLNEVEDAVGTRMLYSLTDLDPARLIVERAYSKMSL